MKKDIRKTVALITNILVIVLNSYALVDIFFNGLGGNMSGGRSEMFKFFTVDSNILLVLASIMTVVCLLKKNTPKWCTRLKFAAVHGTTVTLLVATCFLSLSFGLIEMVKGNNFFLHLFCPLIAVLSFIFLEDNHKVEKNDLLYANIPMLIYGIIYYILVVEKEIWADFYGFNRGGRWYFAVIIMGVFGYALAQIIRKMSYINSKE